MRNYKNMMESIANKNHQTILRSKKGFYIFNKDSKNEEPEEFFENPKEYIKNYYHRIKYRNNFKSY